MPILYKGLMNKPYNKPDLKAPRFRPTRTSLLNRVLYDAFIKKYPQHKAVSVVTFKKIISTFNSELCDGVIQTRDGVELPEGLGFIFMGTCPPAKKSNIDFKRSIECGMKVTFQNWDSDNNLMKIFYTNHSSKYPLMNKQIWAFKAIKRFRHNAAEAYKEDWPKYIVVDPTLKISSFFTKIRKGDFIMREVKNIPDNYDEFKL